jgi:predicted phosphodiesterase
MDAPEFSIPKVALAKRLPKPSELILPWSGPPPASMIVDSDNHFPWHDKRMQAAKLKFAQDIRPDFWFRIGDHYDFTGLSRFDKDPKATRYLQQEFDSSQEDWTEVCRVSKRQEFLLGNHEDRLYRTIMANAGFFGLRALEDWHVFAEIPRSVVIRPYGTQRQVGLLWGSHGDEVKGQNPCYTAMAHRDARVQVFGHTHRLAAYYRTRRNEDGKVVIREAWNTGHGSDLDVAARWAGAMPNWQHGFLFVEHYRDRGAWKIQVHPIKVEGGSFMFRGKVYRG